MDSSNGAKKGDKAETGTQESGCSCSGSPIPIPEATVEGSFLMVRFLTQPYTLAQLCDPNFKNAPHLLDAQMLCRCR